MKTWTVHSTNEINIQCSVLSQAALWGEKIPKYVPYISGTQNSNPNPNPNITHYRQYITKIKTSHQKEFKKSLFIEYTSCLKLSLKFSYLELINNLTRNANSNKPKKITIPKKI